MFKYELYLVMDFKLCKISIKSISKYLVFFKKNKKYVIIIITEDV